MTMDDKNTGCFAWCISFKKSVNERWARFRNRIRRRFFASRGEIVDPATILNETGTNDMLISKTPYRCNKVEPNALAPSFILKDDPVNVECVPTADDGRYFDKLVEEYVSGIITVAAERLRADAQQLPSNTRVITVTATDDNVSLSSSSISRMADTAVTESLTNIVLDTDRNQSSQKGSKPRTIKEFMEVFGIARENAADEVLPRVSE